MRPGALPDLPEPQAALPRPTARSGPALSLPRLGDEAPLRGEQELYSQHALLYRFQQGEWTLQGKVKAKLLVLSGKVRFMLQEERTKKILCNFVVQGPGPYCELKPNAGSDRTWVWEIPWTGGEPDHLGLKVASKELALQFKGDLRGSQDVERRSRCSQRNGVMDSTASPGRYRNIGHCATYVKNNRVLVAGETKIGLLTTGQRRQQGIVSDVDVLVRSKIRVLTLPVCVFTSAK